MNLNLKKVGIIGSAILVMGSLGYAFSTTPVVASQTGAHNLRGADVTAVTTTNTAAAVAPVTGAVLAVDPTGGEAKLALVPPPAELPRSGAKGSPVKPVAASSKAVPASSKALTAKKVLKVQTAMATVKKPKNLFSYVRMLNYSPHPLKKNFCGKNLFH